MAAELVEAKVSEREWLWPGQAGGGVRTAPRRELGRRGAGCGGAGGEGGTGTRAEPAGGGAGRPGAGSPAPSGCPCRPLSLLYRPEPGFLQCGHTAFPVQAPSSPLGSLHWDGTGGPSVVSEAEGMQSDFSIGFPRQRVGLRSRCSCFLPYRPACGKVCRDCHKSSDSRG